MEVHEQVTYRHKSENRTEIDVKALFRGRIPALRGAIEAFGQRKFTEHLKKSWQALRWCTEHISHKIPKSELVL